MLFWDGCQHVMQPARGVLSRDNVGQQREATGVQGAVKHFFYKSLELHPKLHTATLTLTPISIQMHVP